MTMSNNQGWDGRPRLTDGSKPKVKDGDVTGWFVPMKGPSPVLIQINGSPDCWATVFSTMDKLTAHMEYVQQQLGPINYRVARVDYSKQFAEPLWQAGIRIMMDPRVVGPNHTKWDELIHNERLEAFIEDNR
jgi:hypothetical protein